MLGARCEEEDPPEQEEASGVGFFHSEEEETEFAHDAQGDIDNHHLEEDQESEEDGDGSHVAESDDICQRVDCSTNGVCKDGLCLCGNGFAGKNCEIEVKAILKTIRDLEQELDKVKNLKRLCERQLIDLQPMQINPTEAEVLKQG